MSKKKRTPPNAGNRPNAPATPMADLNKAIKEARPDGEPTLAAKQAADESGIVVGPNAGGGDEQPPAGQTLQEACLTAYRAYLAIRETYEQAKEALDQRQASLADQYLDKELELETAREELEQQRAELEKLVAELEPQRNDLARQREDITRRQEDVAGHLAALDQREVDLARRETELASGRLAAAFEMYVAPLEQRRTELFTTFADDVARAQHEARASLERLLNDATARSAELEEMFRVRSAELDTLRHDLELQSAAVETERSRLGRLEESLNAQRDELVADVQAEAEEARRLIDIERDIFNETVRQRQRDMDRVFQKSALVESWERELGDLEGVLHQIEASRGEIQRLRDELNRRATLAEEVDVRALERERTALAERVTQLTNEIYRLDQERAGLRSELLNAQAIIDNEEGMRATIESYREQLRQLRGDLENMSKTQQSKSPFRECSRMDADTTLQRRPNLVPDEELDLSEFIDMVQFGLFNTKERTARLSYRKRDLRLFLAGLAMSRLHILEGVSGTGKTTLPIAFARHIGGGAENVAVQAGWRDRQDLLGYFNEFQGHFRESDFLRGVYRAMTPAHAEGVFFVVLDEMNLSKVEQYFADYLKALEDVEGADRENGGKVPLMDRSDIPYPAHLEAGRSGGVVLPLPSNVWFIGTANQDETTQSFAPKTQSRAHIMQLPHTKPTDDHMRAELGTRRRTALDSETVPVTMLRAAFYRAQQDPGLREGLATLTKAFTDINQAVVKLDPSLSLAPRFYRQLEAFVPVLLASGGDLQLAADHLVCTKVIRRMNERYNIQRADRGTFNQSLQQIWGDYRLGDYAATAATEMLGARVDR
jgi:hypothetical protein